MPDPTTTSGQIDWRGLNSSDTWIALVTLLYLDFLDATGMVYQPANSSLQYLLVLLLHIDAVQNAFKVWPTAFGLQFQGVTKLTTFSMTCNHQQCCVCHTCCCCFCRTPVYAGTLFTMARLINDEVPGETNRGWRPPSVMARVLSL